MQLYDALPLLTAQPPEADRTQAPHRLYAHFPPDAACSSAKWRTLALAEIEAALAADSLPVIVGGTGFYLKTLIQGLSPIPDVPHELRGKIAAMQRDMGNPAFHAELAKRDPKMAAKLHPFNTQRLVRAWEVLEATGKSLADWQELPREAPCCRRARSFTCNATSASVR
jgi:tRNA dimethylallyltransferase